MEWANLSKRGVMDNTGRAAPRDYPREIVRSSPASAVQSFCFHTPDGAVSCTINETFYVVELTNLYNGAKFLNSPSEG